MGMQVVRSWKEGRRLYYEAHCKVCGKLYVFQPALPRATCSPECTEVARSQHRPVGRPVVTRTFRCKVCAREFTVQGRLSSASHRVTCSPKCKRELSAAACSQASGTPVPEKAGDLALPPPGSAGKSPAVAVELKGSWIKKVVPNIVRSWKVGQRHYHEAPCKACGKLYVFTTTQPRTACSPECTEELRAKHRPAGRPTVTHTYRCAVCGKDFLAGRKISGRKVTCSPECERELCRRLFATRMERMHKNAVKARAISPLHGPFATNIHACRWSLVDPGGRLHEFENLSLFIREHSHLFAKEDLTLQGRSKVSRASSGLAKLAPMRSYRKRSWKGWAWGDENVVPVRKWEQNQEA